MADRSRRKKHAMFVVKRAHPWTVSAISRRTEIIFPYCHGVALFTKTSIDDNSHQGRIGKLSGKLAEMFNVA